MAKLQQTADESSYFLTLKKEHVDSRGWKKGDEFAFFVIGDGRTSGILPKDGDLILRKI